MRRTFRRALLPAILATLVVASLAWAAHTTLTKALPAIDGTVTAAPTELTLWFNERPDVALSNIRLQAPDSTMITLSSTTAGPDTLSLKALVRGTIAPGKYTVLYRTAGNDGHVMRGKYQFTLQP
jgi:methionine-rich copper-binding protein CopC